MGITPFFVENVSELQLCAIKLVTAVRFHFYLENATRVPSLTFVNRHETVIYRCLTLFGKPLFRV